MLQLKNATPFAGTICLMPDEQGVDTLYTVIKGSFVLDQRLSVADEQAPVTLADEYYGEPGQSSIKTPSDLCLTKPATDVLLIGSAHAPGGRPTTQMDVSLTVGPVSRTVRVFGDRTWQGGGVGHSISDPVPFTAMPIVWERAYGGTDPVGEEVLGEPRNPVGAGFRAPKGEKPLDGLPLPNCEDPMEPIGSWRDAPPPAGFAPICAHWEPRRSYAGTYDEAWQQQRAPYLPEDFDARFFQLAPPGLVTPGYLGPGTWVQAQGVTPGGVLQFQLPPVQIEVTYVLDHAPQPVTANLDTVLIQADDARLVLVWRAALRCDKKALRVNEVRPALRRVA